MENLNGSRLPAHTDRAEKGIIASENPQRNERDAESVQAFSRTERKASKEKPPYPVDHDGGGILAAVHAMDAEYASVSCNLPSAGVHASLQPHHMGAWAMLCPFQGLWTSRTACP